MTTTKFVLWFVIALVAIPAGQWIGGRLEQKRVDDLFHDLREQEAKDAAYMEGFEAAQKANLDEFNRMNEARVQAAIQAGRELAAELGL